MSPFVVGIIAGIAGVLAGVVMGRGGGRSSGMDAGRKAGIEEGRAEGLEQSRRLLESQMRTLVDSVKEGRLPDSAKPGSPEAQLLDALRGGWAPKNAERELALREAIGRVSAFLSTQVRDPLAGAPDGADAPELRERIERALGALADLDFFVAEVEEVRTGTDLTKLAQRVSREFASDHDIGVRLLLGSATVRAEVNPPALMDALYLVLHNAARFGKGGTIDLVVDSEGGAGRIVVRDRGEGFTEEAFRRAFDPFYSTSDEGLGLGLPHARKVVEGMGGSIELRNVPGGGAEVEISF